MTIDERLELLHRLAVPQSLKESPASLSPDQCDWGPIVAVAVDGRTPPMAESLASMQPGEADKTAIADILELILKRRARLERLIREPSLQSQLLPKFLAIAVIGFVLFGVALALVFTAADEWPRLVPVAHILAGETTSIVAFESSSANGNAAAKHWMDGSAFALITAYALGLIAATGICLPSLYFYGLLAGVRMTMLDVVSQALKAKATAAVALVGILPIYAALGLAVVIFDLPDLARHATFWLGMILPFLAGLFGTYSLYQGLAGFADTLPAARRSRRECFLRRLVISWGACYTAVTPLMIHSLWVMLVNL
jgi:hypothetical protein